MVRREMYRLPDKPDRGIIALRDSVGWLWCEQLIVRGEIRDAGPFTDEEFLLAFEVMPEPAWVVSIDLEIPPIR